MSYTQRSLIRVAVALAAATSNAIAADLTNADLMRTWANLTMVFNKSGEAVGRRLDSYCAGYLESALHSLAVQDTEPCSPRISITPEYLLSVYDSYLRDMSVSLEDSAARTLRSAFMRAFSCTK
jgi:hypothetical protein